MIEKPVHVSFIAECTKRATSVELGCSRIARGKSKALQLHSDDHIEYVISRFYRLFDVRFTAQLLILVTILSSRNLIQSGLCVAKGIYELNIYLLLLRWSFRRFKISR